MFYVTFLNIEREIGRYICFPSKKSQESCVLGLYCYPRDVFVTSFPYYNKLFEDENNFLAMV